MFSLEETSLPIDLSGFQTVGSVVAAYTNDKKKQVIHLSYVGGKRIARASQFQFYYTRSYDGKNWTKPQQIGENLDNLYLDFCYPLQNIISKPKVSNTLFFTYISFDRKLNQYGPIKLISSTDNGKNWSKPISLSKKNFDAKSLSSFPSITSFAMVGTDKNARLFFFVNPRLLNPDYGVINLHTSKLEYFKHPFGNNTKKRIIIDVIEEAFYNVKALITNSSTHLSICTDQRQ